MFALVLLVFLSPILADEPVDFHPEEPCNRAGGQCIKKDECSVDIQKEYLGLCPKQRAKGAECCHGVSTKEYRCNRFGGECFAKGASCPPFLQRPKATDCPPGQFCCVVVGK